MKFAYGFGLVVVAAMMFVASASATTGTDSSGGSPLEVGNVIHGTNVGNFALDGTINISCNKSTVSGTVSNAGSGSSTVTATLGTFTLEECGNNTLTVENKGILEYHTYGASADGNATVTSTGLAITELTHNILGTVHCTYKTNNSHFGTLTGSPKTGGTPLIHIDVLLDFVSTDFGCSSEAEGTGAYSVSTPDYLSID